MVQKFLFLTLITPTALLMLKHYKPEKNKKKDIINTQFFFL